MLQTPVLFIIFNRPEITQRTFAQIRKAKPQKLFVAADGPRLGYPDDPAKCKDALEIIRQIDWKCDLYTLFREENRGCGHGPAEAITWFFEHVEDGIIIEDDSYLSKDGFYFYLRLLDSFKHNHNVGVITANNLMQTWKAKSLSYIIAGPVTPTMGCWATWRRAWRYFDYDLNEYGNKISTQMIQKNIRFSNSIDYWNEIFSNLKLRSRSDVWDYQWHFARSVYIPLTIVSSNNMVSNLGFSDDATHTKAISGIANLPIYKCKNSIKHRTQRRDYLFDWVVFERFYNSQKISLIKKTIIKIIKILYS